MSRVIIGLSGRRRGGKSTLADHLVYRHGFVRLHPFEGGKAACGAYLRHIGVPEDEALRMTHGDLKDTPSAWLPDNQTPRYLMERLGKFMGVDMGPEWTLGQELARSGRLAPDRDIVVESVVYEADVLRSFGGVIIRVDRPGQKIVGVETDAFTDRCTPDHVFRNDLDDIPETLARFDDMLSRIGLIRNPEDDMAPG